MDTIALVKKVLSTHKIVDDPKLDASIIDRVAKIIAKEFEVKAKFAEDEGPISIATGKATAPTAPSQSHFSDVVNKIAGRTSPTAKAAVKSGQAITAPIDLDNDNDGVGEGDEGDIDLGDGGGLEAIDEGPRGPGLPTRMNDVSGKTAGKNHSIRRLS